MDMEISSEIMQIELRGIELPYESFITVDKPISFMKMFHHFGRIETNLCPFAKASFDGPQNWDLMLDVIMMLDSLFPSRSVTRVTNTNGDSSS